MASCRLSSAPLRTIRTLVSTPPGSSSMRSQERSGAHAAVAVPEPEHYRAAAEEARRPLWVTWLPFAATAALLVLVAPAGAWARLATGGRGPGQARGAL